MKYKKYLVIIVGLAFISILTYAMIIYPHSLRTFEVVVARYNENLDWVNKEFINEKITIYNKGKNDFIPLPNWTVIELPNVGRESHTYLYHIVTNYNNLADRTLFIQGRPYDHEIYTPFLEYKTRIFKNYNNLCKNIIAPCRNKNQRRLDYMSESLDTNRHSWVYRKGVVYDTLHNFLYTVVNRKLPSDTKIGGVQGAIFAVDKEVILQHSKQYYQDLLSVLDNIYPEEGYYFEKLWDVIFDNGKYKDIDKAK